MVDIKKLREDPAAYQRAADVKAVAVDIDRLLEVDKLVLQLKQELDELRTEKNQLARQQADPEKGRAVKEKIKAKEGEVNLLEPELEKLMLLVPNLPSEDTPVGKDDAGNQEVYRWGDIPQPDFALKDHLTLGAELDLLDFERGVRTSGFRGYYLKNEAALLHLALMQYALKKIIERGFTPFIPPTLVREFALIGSGHFPFGQEEIYEIKNPDDKERKFLTGTAEPSLLAYRAGEILDEAELPLKFCGLSQCYRSEAGSYGKDAKGIYRIHEFMKVEQVVLCRADTTESNQWLETMTGYSRELLEDLRLPYRVVQVCTGDMGAGKHKMYDLETWMPSRNAYSETHSASNLTDWQARRLGIRYRTNGGEKVYPHCLNNTVIASPRILIAILENFQQQDGSIAVPEALWPFCGFKKIERRSGK
ncbi:MAG: serine--tRNA ligase [Candidatus Buchananbacteria bacterium RIFCSPLOWO2_01_FULL_56_15]|uniref:Serine--tRNA ligase n=2 Tax=Candidatus Buchananiibacteriota TaxID=1817903 RepID=A0A1G1YK15_9BACT|nr:MAG: serine--tRNA ligase [Candidatus Buchananbacteria bacterium RIFCSPHIGHO2_02_FULL_56_16]OGY54796.1 MAG: serine--tRNA ligase [Candidatus Buchananbacteria bacterium RIFCSPLOWO2_01_FULL_56_15]